MAAGYSGTPLPNKLGIKQGHYVAVRHEPPEFRDLLVGLPDDVEFHATLREEPDVVVAFYSRQAALESEFGELADAVFPDRTVWLAWPKKTASVETDLSGDVVRAMVLTTKLVDVKICAISETWSGMKCVWRKKHRRP